MRSSLNVAMVVFKCLLLLLVVFFIQGSYCKPAYDKQAKDRGIGSTLWGWVTYLNPWGSDANTSDISPIPEQRINSIISNNGSVAEARLLTAATIPVNPTTAVEPASKQSLEPNVATAPFISAQISSTSKNPTTEHSLEPKASTTAITSAQKNLLTSEKFSTEYSFEPKAPDTPKNLKTTEVPDPKHLELGVSTTLIPSNQDIATTTEEFVLEQYFKPEISTTILIVSKQNILTTTEEFMPEHHWELEMSTTPIASVQDNPITTEASSAEHYLEPEVSTTLIVLNQDISTTIKEPVSAGEHFKLEESTAYIVMYQYVPTSTEESATERPLEPEPSTTTSIFNNPVIIKTLTTDETLKLEATTTFTSMDQNIPTLTQVPASEQPLNLQSPTTWVLRSKASPVSKDMDQNNNNNGVLLQVEVPAMGEMSVLTEPVHVPYPEKAVVVTGRDEVSTAENQVLLLTELATDSYPGVEVAVTEREELVSTGVKEVSILTEAVTDQYSGVEFMILGRDKVSTKESEVSILNEFITNPYPGVEVAVTGRGEMFTKGNEAANVIEPATGPFPGVEVTVSCKHKLNVSLTLTDSAPNILTEVEAASLMESAQNLSTLISEFSSIGVDESLSSEEDAVSTGTEEVFTLTESTAYSSTGKYTLVSIERSTNPLLEGTITLSTSIEGVSTEVGVMSATEDGVSARVHAVSTEAVSTGVDKTVFIKVDRFAAPRLMLPKSSATHNKGFRLRFDYRFMILFYAFFLYVIFI